MVRTCKDFHPRILKTCNALLNQSVLLIENILCAGLICVHCYLGNIYGVWGRGLWNCCFFSILAVLVGLLFFCASNANQRETSIVARVLLWVSKYEYGIYLWHLLIMNNLLAHSGLLQAMLTPRRMILAYIMLIGCSIVTGHIMTVLVNGLKLPTFKSKDKIAG